MRKEWEENRWLRGRVKNSMCCTQQLFSRAGVVTVGFVLLLLPYATGVHLTLRVRLSGSCTQCDILSLSLFFLLSSCFPSHWSLVLLLSIVSPGLLLVIDCFTQHTFSASYGTFPFHQLRLVPSWFTCCLDVSPDSYRILQSSRAFVCLVSVSVDEPTWRLSALSSLCILAPKVFFFFSCFLTGKLSLFVQVSHPHWPLPFSLQVILQKECGLRKLMWNQHWTLLTVAIKICRLKTFFTSSPLN